MREEKKLNENNLSIAEMREEMKELMNKNISLSEDVLALTKKINNFIVWQKVFGVVKIVIFIIPIILGFIYLPPLLKNVFASYEKVLGTADHANTKLLDFDIGKYLK